ncbi:MAG: replication terminator protein [Lachnospiraceae bacterium]|nr:replication terminator protein [Lachnospiraceae bacterium]
MAKEILTLASMCGGGVQERINRALAKISDNILDPNTEAKKKRVLTVKIELTPSEDDREDVVVDVSTAYKLAPEVGLKTQLFINKDFKTGEISITEHAKGQIKGQLTLDDYGMSTDQKEEQSMEELAKELGCDPDTGEVLEQPEESQGKVVNLRNVKSG